MYDRTTRGDDRVIAGPVYRVIIDRLHSHLNYAAENEVTVCCTVVSVRTAFSVTGRNTCAVCPGARRRLLKYTNGAKYE